jgi:hypothetical protein
LPLSNPNELGRTKPLVDWRGAKGIENSKFVAQTIYYTVEQK